MAVPSSSPSRRLHAFAREPRGPNTTYRLYFQQRPVGLAKWIGGGYFFSTDGGFAWTGQEIQADLWAAASCLRDHKNQVLHSGDVVLERGSSNPKRSIVVVDDQLDTWLYRIRGRQLERMDAASSRPRWQKLVFVKSGLGMQQSMRHQIDHALRTMHLARALTWRDVAAFTLALTLSASACCLVCWWAGGQVGFMAPLVTTFLVSWALHRWRMMQNERRLSRSAMLALTHRVALVGGTVLATVLALSGLLASELTQQAGFRVWVVAWIAGVSGCGIVCLLSGDLAVWQCGGYPGEGVGPSKSGGGR